MMRPSKFTDAEVLQALSDVKGGESAAAVCRRLGITETTFYRWRAQHALDSGESARQLRELRAENQRLKELVANLVLDQQRGTPRRK